LLIQKTHGITRRVPKDANTITKLRSVAADLQRLAWPGWQRKALASPGSRENARGYGGKYWMQGTNLNG